MWFFVKIPVNQSCRDTWFYTYLHNTYIYFLTSLQLLILFYQALVKNNSPPRCLNFRNKEGYTPLHTACRADKWECVNALLIAGADVNITASRIVDEESRSPSFVGDYLQEHSKMMSQEDVKFGGTPLHWACSKPVVQALVEKNCNINAVNFQLRTALHIMVNQTYFARN